MKLEYAQEFGETLLDYAFDILWIRSTCGVNHAEFIFVRFAEHLKDYPALKGWFLKQLKSTLDRKWLNLAEETKRPKDFLPSEIVEYIAYVTRWPEFRDLASIKLSEMSDDQAYLMNRNLASSILKALDNEWEDVDFYRSLSNQPEK